MILVMGGSGQLARTLAVRKAGPVRVRVIGRPEFDFRSTGGHPAPLLAALADPAVVVNAAAYTAVDRAESEPDEAAWRANAEGPGAAGGLVRGGGAYR